MKFQKGRNPNSHSQTKIGKDPVWVVSELREAGWELRDISLIYDRLLALCKAGELPEDVMVRLNPSKPVTRPYVAPVAAGRDFRASPSRALTGSAPSRGARTRLST